MGIEWEVYKELHMIILRIIHFSGNAEKRLADTLLTELTEEKAKAPHSMARTALPSTLLSQTSLVSFPSQNNIPCKPTTPSSFTLTFQKRVLVRCSAKKKISFVDQILDYIEGTTPCNAYWHLRCTSVNVFWGTILVSYLCWFCLCWDCRRPQVEEMVWGTWPSPKRWNSWGRGRWRWWISR